MFHFLYISLNYHKSFEQQQQSDKYEISHCGFTELLSKDEMIKLNKIILDKFRILDYDNYTFKMFTSEYVTIDIFYSPPDRDGDCEMEITLGEFLNI